MKTFQSAECSRLMHNGGYETARHNVGRRSKELDTRTSRQLDAKSGKRDRRCFIESQATSAGSVLPPVTPVFVSTRRPSKDSVTDVRMLVEELRNEVELVDELATFMLNQLKPKDITFEENRVSAKKSKETKDNLVIEQSSRIHDAELAKMNRAACEDLPVSYRDRRNQEAEGSAKDFQEVPNAFMLPRKSRCISVTKIPENSSITESLNIPETERKDYSIASIENDLLSHIEGRCRERPREVLELLRRCPYMEQLRRTSEKYRAVLLMLETLVRYNELMKKLLARNVAARSQLELERYSQFFKKNRSLRIDIKCLLGEKDENQRRIERMKETMNVFGVGKGTFGQVASDRVGTTKRELVKFRDRLMQENDILLLRLKRKLE